MTYDYWKTTEPTREPAPGEHRPYDEECDCDECASNRLPGRGGGDPDPAEDPEGEPVAMAPWFAGVMELCQSLALDSAADRQTLWEYVHAHLPHGAIETMIADNIGYQGDDSHERVTARVAAAVIAALDES